MCAFVCSLFACLRDRCSLFVVCCLLVAVQGSVFVVCCLLCVVCWLLLCCVSVVVCCVFVCCLLFAGCWLRLAGWCLMCAACC